uniref:Uncharacterized protein n=1 Tax=Eutreptiella gymnastica TaxID=73025 RepID=A0A7S1N491_9EUGL|mmetsp:Transcript_116813/g.203224  ORF Transcript_116813/g.203224 Transcript_116813/m.203224 type:complete len:119 (+) Transcript_116813:47-403(+)
MVLPQTPDKKKGSSRTKSKLANWSALGFPNKVSTFNNFSSAKPTSDLKRSHSTKLPHSMSWGRVKHKQNGTLVDECPCGTDSTSGTSTSDMSPRCEMAVNEHLVGTIQALSTVDGDTN